MSLKDYHISIGKELNDLKNRFRNLLGNENYHKLSDGKHKESILKNIFARHLPRGISAKNGFIKFDADTCSSEIDILLHVNDRPMLFQNDDIVIVTPHSVFGGIEVKTNLKKQDAPDVFSKIADNAKSTIQQLNIANIQSFGHTLDFKNFHNFKNPWFSLFAYQANIDDNSVLEYLDNASSGDYERVIDCLCLGPNKFVRFWSGHKKHQYSNEKPFVGWRIYELQDLAFSYFISNMIWQDQIKTSETNPWFALEDKEINMVCEREFTQRK